MGADLNKGLEKIQSSDIVQESQKGKETPVTNNILKKPEAVTNKIIKAIKKRNPELNQTVKNATGKLLLLTGKEQGKEDKEKSPEEIKNEIVDGIIKEKLGDKYDKYINNGYTKEFMRERYLKANEKKLVVKDEDGKEIKSKEYIKILEENKSFAKLDEKNPDFTKKLLTVYGTENIELYEKLIDIAGKRGEKLPTNLIEFDKFIKEQIKKHPNFGNKFDTQAAKEEGNEGETNMTEEQKKEYVNNIKNDPTLLKALLSNEQYTPVGNLERGNDVANNALLDGAIDKCKIPRRKQLLISLKNDLGVNEANNPDKIREYHKKAGLNAGPSLSWCMSFVQAKLSDNGLEHHKTARARDGLVMGVDVGREPKPGDLVIVARKGTDSAGNPGGHIGFYLGKNANGEPIILGGNQHNSVSIKVERRPILGYRSVIPQGEDKKKEV